MLSYLSKASGIGGKLKSSPEDFIVEEIAPDGTVYELNKEIAKADDGAAYTRFILQKTDWSTSSAMSEIARRLHIGQKNLNTAGTKDKLAITTQLASVRGDRKDDLLDLRIKDISINGTWLSKDRVRLGELLGNRFTIVVRDMVEDADERVAKISAELDGEMPNYFGEQRFGSTRKNTHKIGELLLQGKLEEAAMSFLCDSEGENNPQAKMARQGLLETKDFSKALKDYPKHLRLERSMLDHLAKGEDYLGALRKLPRNILLLFVHAFQSHLFNRLLSERIAEGEPELEEGEYFCGESLGFPDIKKTEAEGWIVGKLIGYNTPLNERERALLEQLSIDKDHFRMKAIPEISSKGTYRTLLAPLKDFRYDGKFRFSLPSGSYATVAMREFMKD